MVAYSPQAGFLRSGQIRNARGSTPYPARNPAGPGSTIGLVSFRTHRGERAEAILDAAGRWRCPALPVLDRVLNALFAPAAPGDDGASFGHPELVRVAAWIKGEARFVRSRE